MHWTFSTHISQLLLIHYTVKHTYYTAMAYTLHSHHTYYTAIAHTLHSQDTYYPTIKHTVHYTFSTHNFLAQNITHVAQ